MSNAVPGHLPDVLSEKFPEVSIVDGVDMPHLEIGPEKIVEILTTLRDRCGFQMLSDVSASDWLPAEPRFVINYHLRSFEPHAYFRVKVRIGESDVVPSVSAEFPTAVWQEREIFDMFGISFSGHPDLRRILLPDEWVGHPLRKDYPMGGVPVEYRIEPSYAGAGHNRTDLGRSAAGGSPARLSTDRRRLMTWTGPPASGVRSRVIPKKGDDTE